MKTRYLQIWPVGVAALAILVASGCAQSSATNAPAATVSPTNLPAAVATTGAADQQLAEVTENAPPPERAEPAPGSDANPVPTDLKLSPAAREIVKLAQSGVHSSVMLSYVTNTAGTFNLASDQIIFLNDLGVDSEVITSMIEHDRLLREGGGSLPPMATTAAPAAVAEPVDQADAATVAAAAAPQALEQPQSATGEAPPPAATTEAVPAPLPNVTYNYFYDSLAPYGTWIEVDGYGRCWQPSVVVLQSGWRPYSQGGRWLYTDYGWYWQSDYSWGWAPFHYGRWFSHPRWGWCWRPDTIWGPAWVSWRYTDAYCGWAPLPPAALYRPGFGFTYFGSSVGWSFGFGLGWDCYSFVSWGHFRHHHPHRYCAPPHHARQIYHGSHVANHISVGRDHKIINHGVGVDRVQHLTKTSLRPVHVRDLTMDPRSPRLTPGDRLERGGKELVIRRPNLPPTAAPPVAKPTGRPESRGTSAIALRDRPGSPESRSSRAPAPTITPSRSDKSGGEPAGKPAAPTRTITRTSPRDAMPSSPQVPRSREPSPVRTAPQPAKPAVAPAPAAPSRSGTVVARQNASRPNNVITFGRRETSPAAPATSPTRTVTRPAQERPSANTTTTWARPANPPQSVTRSYTPSAPAPSTPSAPQWSAPVRSAPPAVSRPSSPPSYSPPVPRSTPSPAPAPSYTPRPTPPPSYTPRPTPSAPAERSVAPAPRSSPAPSAPARSSNSGGGRSEGGRGGQRQR